MALLVVFTSLHGEGMEARRCRGRVVQLCRASALSKPVTVHHGDAHKRVNLTCIAMAEQGLLEKEKELRNLVSGLETPARASLLPHLGVRVDINDVDVWGPLWVVRGRTEREVLAWLGILKKTPVQKWELRAAQLLASQEEWGALVSVEDESGMVGSLARCMTSASRHLHGDVLELRFALWAAERKPKDQEQGKAAMNLAITHWSEAQYASARRAVAKAFLATAQVPIRTVVCFTGPAIAGELRTPEDGSCEVLLHNAEARNRLKPSLPLSPTETIHLENGIKYSFDVARVMFAPGNGTERGRAATYLAGRSPPTTGRGEVVVDMFAGIGYFSVPIACATASRELLGQLVCLEKNPVSCHYLARNMALNGARPGSFLIIEGDNREQGDKWLGKADRVSLGYLPSAEPFLERALAFLKAASGSSAEPASVGVLHYHYIAPRNAAAKVATLHIERAVSAVRAADSSIECSTAVDRVVAVKSYAPHLWHYVADVSVRKSIKSA